MANFDPEKLNRQLTKIVVNVLEAQEASVVNAMNGFQADLKTRVINGQDIEGQQIGKYSTEPIYVSLSGATSQVRSSSLQGKGKNSTNPEFKNGKKRKSQYMPGGYKEYRGIVGRQTEKVDLFLTGSMLGSITLGQTGNNYAVGFNNDDQVKKAQGNEEHFNKIIFAPSLQELENIEDTVFKAVEDAFFDSFE